MWLWYYRNATHACQRMKGREVPSLLLLYFLFGFCFCYSVTQSCTTFCDPMDRSISGFPVLHYLPELAQIHAHWVGDAICFSGDSILSGEGNGNPLQYSCLENSMDKGAWQAIDHGIPKSWTWLSDYHSLIPYCQTDNIKHCLKSAFEIYIFF